MKHSFCRSWNYNIIQRTRGTLKSLRLNTRATPVVPGGFSRRGVQKPFDFAEKNREETYNITVYSSQGSKGLMRSYKRSCLYYYSARVARPFTRFTRRAITDHARHNRLDDEVFFSLFCFTYNLV